MPIPALNASVGTRSANTYADLAYADNYHEARLHNAQWVAASEDQKTQALLWATILLDNNVRFVGRRYGLYQDQALQWPRQSVYDSNGFYIEFDVVPKQVKDAQCELAWLLLQSDRTSATTGAATASIRSVKVGPISLGFNESKVTIETIPPSVINLLQGLGSLKVQKGPRSVRLVRS